MVPAFTDAHSSRDKGEEDNRGMRFLSVKALCQLRDGKGRPINR